MQACRSSNDLSKGSHANRTRRTSAPSTPKLNVIDVLEVLLQCFSTTSFLLPRVSVLLPHKPFEFSSGGDTEEEEEGGMAEGDDSTLILVLSAVASESSRPLPSLAAQNSFR